MTERSKRTVTRGAILNMTCLLPATCVGASMWEPHPCGGYFMREAWCYGPHGRIGYWVDAPTPARRNEAPDV